MSITPDAPTVAGLLRSGSRLGGLWRDRHGAAAVELALLLPILVLMLAGLIDLSRLISQTMQVRAAAQAGADHALRRGWNAAAVEAAVTRATPLSVTATPAPQSLVGCVSGGAVVAEAGPTCPAGGKPGLFVTVAAQAPFAAILPGPHRLILPETLSASALVRVE